MAPSPKRPQEQDPTTSLRRRLWLERAAFGVVVLGLVLLYLGAVPGGRRVCLVTVDGEPVAVLETRADAERILGDIKSRSGLELEQVQFAQEVGLRDVSALRNPVRSDSQATEALSSRLDVVVEAAAILANGELVAALPIQAEAVRTLSLLLTELAPPGRNTAVFFKEKVKVEMQAVAPERRFASAGEAVQRIVQEASSGAEYMVKPGDSAWRLARDHRIPLSRLAQANPGIDLDNLLAGAELKIPGAQPLLTVVARREVREEVEEVPDRRTRTVRITYENGVETKRDILGPSGVHRIPRAAPQRAAPQRAAPQRAAPPPAADPWRWRDEIPL